MTLPDLKTSIASYEASLAKQFGPALNRDDLKLKHKKMRKSAFKFLRGTCWRWAEAAPSLCPDLVDAPRAGSVGDAHAGNFGLWRDAQFRLVWGVNDYDEAARLPYPLDLVRLGASLIMDDDGISDDGDAASVADNLLSAYQEGLAMPAPFVLEDRHLWLRDLFENGSEERAQFWEKLEALDDHEAIPPEFEASLLAALPGGTTHPRFRHRQAGVGSLGRPRFVAFSTYRGGALAVEIKGAMPSCWQGREQPGLAKHLATGRFRSPDPTLRYEDAFVLRRLAPNNRKLTFSEIKPKLKVKLIAAMARELAAIHAADGEVKAISDDLRGRPEGWLADTIHRVAKWTVKEWDTFKDGD
ncbi:hypothetical protein BJF92_18535 [Rhizobium rhizosphaerae]|uniref:DUF2252 domain-containing protein n=1 Tax=Xaviernesmea rhizosphaerae TaxID=1672749 RepID=A0A1Q9ADM9_9HYPH|nr:DUF2252 family protein [Xaviernesmea rhizosphaerae]OLP53034.1 hypothetical protein BJF92_18535 [Xaviernesmea rhizosphaerae]